MKISPVSGLGATVGAVSTGSEAPPTVTQRIRSLKMNTNATPGRIEEAVIPPDPALTIPDEIDATKTAEANQPLSPQLAALARQRRALQVKEREIATREKALLEQTPVQGDVIEKARLKSDPLGVLLDSGVTYEQLTEAVLANQNGYTPEIRALKDELKSLKADVDKTLSDRDALAEKQALAEMQREASQRISQGEDFELVRETGSLPKVMQLIELTYRKTGDVLDVTEALKLVEDELVKDGLKIATMKKVQSQFAPPAPVPPPMQQQRQMRTLTNRDNASVPMSRKARALAAWNGTLK